MSKKVYRIFIINPGSTSTKLSLFENRKNIFTTDVFHDSSVLLTFPTINDQLEYRMKVIHEFLEEDHIDLTGIDAVVGRGGGCYAVPGGRIHVQSREACTMLPCSESRWHPRSIRSMAVCVS